MLYSPNRAAIHHIVLWLRGDDETGWLDQIDVLASTIFDLNTMVRPLVRQAVVPPEGMAISLALVQLTSMILAMHRRDRTASLACGQAALALLPDE
jgi:hypothetical protein